MNLTVVPPYSRSSLRVSEPALPALLLASNGRGRNRHAARQRSWPQDKPSHDESPGGNALTSGSVARQFDSGAEGEEQCAPKPKPVNGQSWSAWPGSGTARTGLGAGASTAAARAAAPRGLVGGAGRIVARGERQGAERYGAVHRSLP